MGEAGRKSFQGNPRRIASLSTNTVGKPISVRLAGSALAAILATISWMPPGTSSVLGDELDLRPTSARAAWQEAAAAIPLEKLHFDDRHAVERIVQNASLYRRLPTKVVPCDPRLFSLFMQHPHAMVNLWEVLGISKVRMKSLGNSAFQTSDGNGTVGTIRILESVCDENAQNRAIVFASGQYEGRGVTGPVQAECVALVRSGSVRDHDGATYVTARIDVFVHLQQVGVELVARTLQPLLMRVADRNFTQAMDFVSSFSEAAEKNPRGVERLAARLDQVPDAVRQRLTEIAFDLSTKRHAAASASRENAPAGNG